MRAGLVLKELREHGLPLLLLGVAGALLFTVFLLGNVRDGKPPFAVLGAYVAFFLPLAAWYLGGRLVRREYAGGTQLFLDALPVGRSEVLVAKQGVAALAFAAYVLPAFAVCAAVALRHQDVAETAGAVAARTFAYAALLHAAGIALGFLGRYRVPLLVVSILACLVFLRNSEVEFDEFGPFALVGPKFATGRDLPWGLILASLGVAAALTAVAHLLVHLRDGSVAARMALEMSPRERAFAAVVVVGCAIGLGIYDERRPKPPFAPEAAAEAGGEGVRVVVGATSRMDDAAAQRLADTLRDRLAAARAELGAAALPPVFLFSRSGLDAGLYERGTIEDEEGLVVRANVPSAGWDDGDFTGWLVRELLVERSRGRVRLERRRWVLDGYADLCAERAADRAAGGRRVLRALHAVPGGVTEDDLRAWDSFRDRVGDPAARAVAWTGLRTIARAHGDAALGAFVRDALGAEVPHDARALAHEAENSVPALVERRTGRPFGEFLAAWNGDLARDRAAHAEALARLPRPTAEVRVGAPTDASREIEFTASDVGASATARFEWASLRPFQRDVLRPEIQTHVVTGESVRSAARVPATFRRGERVAWRIAVPVAELGCDVFTPLRRVVLE